jgi:hypothetical protein
MMKNSVKMDEDMKSEFIPYPKVPEEHKLFNRSARSSFSMHKRGITPGPNMPIKLIKPVKNWHETGFNIITNRDKHENSPSVQENDKLMTQAERDYQDYTKSEYSFEYTKIKGN